MNGGEKMDMVFVRFSLSWLTDGADTYTPPTPKEPDAISSATRNKASAVCYTTAGKPCSMGEKGLMLTGDGRKLLNR